MESRQLFPILFIVGAPRSGTTLLRAMLRRHPELAHINSEGLFLLDLLDSYPAHISEGSYAVEELCRHEHFPLEDFGPHIGEIDNQRNLATRDFLALILGRLAIPDSDRRLLIKYPGRAIQELRRLESLFPGSQYIHVVRDPRANVNSQLNMFENRSLRRSIHLWKTCIRNGRQIAGDRELSKRYLEIRYEDLVLRPREALKHICSFAGIAFDPSVLQFEERIPDYSRDAGVNDQRVVSQVQTRSLDRWRSELSDFEVWLTEKACAREMAALNYERSDPQVPTAVVFKESVKSWLHFAVKKARYVLGRRLRLPA